MMNLNFACRTITLEQILKCSFNLNKTEIKILKILLDDKEEKSIDDLKKVVKKDRTTIQRALKRLHERSLIKRRQINLQKGGYTFVYSPNPKSDLKSKINEIFESFRNTVNKEISRW
jgi:predicted transcriptional regulator